MQTTKVTSYTQRLRMPSFTRSSDGGKMPNDTGWQTRHLEALTLPQGAELPIVTLLSAWANYADRHKLRYESGIGEDYVLGPAWAKIGASIRTLLNGESGRLDCGTLDSFLCTTLAAEGYNPDEL